MAEMMFSPADHALARDFALSFDKFLDGFMRWCIRFDDFDFTVAEHIQRKIANQLLGNPFACIDRILPPDPRAQRENLDKSKTGTGALQIECFAYGPAGFHDVLVVGERDALDVDRGLER